MMEQCREREQFSFELKCRILEGVKCGRKKSDVAKRLWISPLDGQLSSEMRPKSNQGSLQRLSTRFGGD